MTAANKLPAQPLRHQAIVKRHRLAAVPPVVRQLSRQRLKKKATATSEDKKDHSQTKSKLPVLISGIVAIIVIVGGGALWLAGGRGRHSRGD